MATAERIVEAHDVGPIEHFKFNAPKSGVVVVKGPNGAGKTTLLDAISSTVSGNGKPPIRDGEERATVSVGDVMLRVGKTARRSGEVDFSLITGRYTIADLIAPGFKDRSACDAHAIKTLAQLAGHGTAQASSLFHELVGSAQAFDEICPAEVIEDLDVVALAGRVERALQKKAREQEDLATGADGKADAFSAGVREVDVNEPHDAADLAGKLESAIRECSALEQRAKDIAKKLADAANARESLEDVEAELSGQTVALAETAVSAADTAHKAALDAVDEAKAKLTAAQEQERHARAALAHARENLESAKSNESVLARFRATVKAAENVEAVSEEQLGAARETVIAAREAVERGAVIRKAIADRESSTEWREKAGRYRKEAEKLRSAAAATDDVLSDLVAKLGSQLYVKRGRLMLKTDRGEESFWELSDGERSEIAVSVFATAVGQNGFIVLPQSFWEGLDWQGRQRIAQHMRRVGVLAWTAECDKDKDGAGELRAEVFEG